MDVQTAHASILHAKDFQSLRRSSAEILALNVLIPLLALVSSGICLLPEKLGVPPWMIFFANIVLTTQIAILTHELIHEPASATRWNLPLRINLHLYSPFTVGFAEYRRLHGLHHVNANCPESDPDYFFIRGGGLRAFLTLAFAPEYLFFYVLHKKEAQPDFYAFHLCRNGLLLGYIYLLGFWTFALLFFIPAKLAWGIGFLLFSYESHIDEHGIREGSFNLEPQSALLRMLLKLLVGPYAYYVAFSHASHHAYPRASGRKRGRLSGLREQKNTRLPARELKPGAYVSL